MIVTIKIKTDNPYINHVKDLVFYISNEAERLNSKVISVHLEGDIK